MKVYYSEVNTGLGFLKIAFNQKGLVKLGLPGESMESFLRYLDEHFKKTSKHGESVYQKELIRYFKGEVKGFSFPLDLKGTDFQKRVWYELLKIPYGKTVSYKTLAENINQPKAVRAVGGANNKNPIPIVVPCHRVVGSDGSMVGYGGGVDYKIQLLKLEGVEVTFKKNQMYVV